MMSHSTNGPRHAIDSAARWIISAVMAIVFCLWQIRSSIDHGSFSLPPTFDDVGYLSDAAARLNYLQSEGLSSFFTHYIALPPHSPLSTLLGMVGFSLFGIYPWAGAAANGILLFFMLRAFFALTTRLRLWVSASLACAFLLHPIAGILITEFRPDPAVALLTAIGTTWLVMVPEDRKSLVIPALICGTALLGKPSIFYLTLLLFGVAFLLANRRLIIDRNWHEFWTRTGIMVALVSAVALPHYIIAASSIWDYIYKNLFGVRATVWATPMPLAEQMNYYLAGSGGQYAQGWWLFVAAAFSLTASALSLSRVCLRTSRAIIAQVYFLLLVCWAFVSFATVKTPFLGLSVASYFLTIGIISSIAILRSLPKPAQSFLVASLLLFGAAVYTSPWTARYHMPVDAAYAKSRTVLIDRIVDILIAQKGLESATIVQPVIAQYFSNFNIEFALHQRGIYGFTTKEQAFATTPEAYRAIPAKYVVEITSDSSDYIRYVPSGSQIEQISELIQSDSALTLVGAVKDELRGGEIRIYERR